MIRHAPLNSILSSILRKITNNNISLRVEDTNSIDISTQSYTEYGIPDIRIENNQFLCYIEVKVDSNFGSDQLTRYKKILDSSTKETYLFVLTRYDYKLHGADITPDFGFKWHSLSDWLANLQLSNVISKYLTDEYISFLEHRGLAMNKINWQLVDGVRSLKSIMSMISEAISGAGINIYSKSGAWEWMGYYIEEKKLFIGVYYDNPEQVVINTEVALDESKPKEPEIGQYSDSGNVWRNILELNDEATHFFSRNKVSQLSCLENFVTESVNYARTIVKT